MTHEELRVARATKGWRQRQAARRLGVSQPYLSMLERGQRPVTPQLARRAMAVFGLPATVLAPGRPVTPASRGTGHELATDLAALGYPRFSHLRPRRWRAKHPGDVLLTALAHDHLEARIVEAMPWLLLTYGTLDREWLVREAKLRDLQNRLGFVATLARELAERDGQDAPPARALRELERALERSRLAREDTLCQAAVSDAERQWLAANRSEAARHWNLLTDWTSDAVSRA